MPTLRRLRPYLVVCLLNMSEGMITMLVPPYLDFLGFAPAAVGFLVSIYGVATLLVRLPAGALYRGLGAQRLLVGALLLTALASLLYPFATNSVGLMLVRAVHGVAYGAATTVNLALFIDALRPDENRGRAMGYFTTALAGGFTLGQAIAGFAGEWLGYTWAFAFAAAPPLLAIPLMERVAPSARARETTPRTGWRLGGMLSALRAPGVLAVSSLAFFLSLLLQITSTFLPLYALGIGLGLAEIGLLRSAHSICNSITRPFTGGFIERVGSGRIGTISLLLNAALVVLIPSFATLLALAVLMIAVGLVRGVAMVANTVGVATEIDETRVSRGLASGIWYASRDIGSIVGPVLGGLVADRIGIEAMFRVLPPAVFALYALVTLLSARHAARRAPAPARGH